MSDVDIEEPDWLAELRSESAAHLGAHEPPSVAKASNGDGGQADADVPHALQLDRLHAHLISGGDVLKIPPPEPLVHGWLDLDSLAVMYGRPKSGKTFVALDVALSVASGSWWHGHEVVAGPVLYIAAEGRRGAGNRVAAWLEQNHLHDVPDGFHLLAMAPSLLEQLMVDALGALVHELAPILVVVDTLARVTPGGNENAAQDMGRFVSAVDELRRRCGACILVIHHSGKDATQGARGHSSLLGAVDFEFEVKNAGDNVVTVHTTASKDHAEQDRPLRFTLRPAAGSVAIADHTGKREPDGELTRGAVSTLDALVEIALPTGVPTSAWETKAEEAGISRSMFYTHRKTLLDRDLVENVGTDNRPKYRPTDQ